jgi:hypothetical protein
MGDKNPDDRLTKLVVGHSDEEGGATTTCTCNAECTCDLVCTCDTVCDCPGQGGGECPP